MKRIIIFIILSLFDFGFSYNGVVLNHSPWVQSENFPKVDWRIEHEIGHFDDDQDASVHFRVFGPESAGFDFPEQTIEVKFNAGHYTATAINVSELYPVFALIGDYPGILQLQNRYRVNIKGVVFCMAKPYSASTCVFTPEFMAFELVDLTGRSVDSYYFSNQLENLEYTSVYSIGSFQAKDPKLERLNPSFVSSFMTFDRKYWIHWEHDGSGFTTDQGTVTIYSILWEDSAGKIKKLDSQLFSVNNREDFFTVDLDQTIYENKPLVRVDLKLTFFNRDTVSTKTFELVNIKNRQPEVIGSLTLEAELNCKAQYGGRSCSIWPIQLKTSLSDQQEHSYEDQDFLFFIP